MGTVQEEFSATDLPLDRLTVADVDRILDDHLGAYADDSHPSPTDYHYMATLTAIQWGFRLLTHVEPDFGGDVLLTEGTLKMWANTPTVKEEWDGDADDAIEALREILYDNLMDNCAEHITVYGCCGTAMYDDGILDKDEDLD